MEPPAAPLRVLLRPTSAVPPPSSTTSSATPDVDLLPPPLPATSASAPPPPDGVVVVGVVGRSSEDVTQLLNRILDAHVFGSGGRDRDLLSDLRGSGESRVPDSPRMSYYHDEGKGVVYVQLSSQNEGPPLVDGAQSDDLKRMLLMFCVCHIVIYVHEESRFDSHILKRLRTLQAARQALAPFIKCHVTPLLSAEQLPSSSSNTNVRSNCSVSSTSSRSSNNSGRHASAISFMSGLSSSPSLYPGQYVPLLLFALLDDYPEGPSPSLHVEDSTDGATITHPATTSFHKPTVPAKAPTSVVMLTRPSSKVEANNRKKLHSSLDSQIRSLIRKSRILTGGEGGHSTGRSGAHVVFSPLFFLDSSRAIVLLDKHLNYKGESLDFTTDLVMRNMLNPNISLDAVIKESYDQNLVKEDIQSVKDVIHRQIETLRGKGGLTTNSGPATGVGMVAVAAAAAAASAASGKPPHVPPRLPPFGDWISAAHVFLKFLLQTDMGEKVREINKCTSANEKEAVHAVDSCLSLLVAGTDPNMKFSSAWCVKALPVAKEIYLKDLPTCYPTIIHESRLNRALQAFHAMVKGPAVHYFMKKLEDECNSVWKSGRQLCDAVSLTGKQCMHRRHVVSSRDSFSDIEVKPHCSGYVFLHACPCGRSRQLRNDPFDFKNANVEINCSADCLRLLPAIQIPQNNDDTQFYKFSLNMIRVGGAKYYDPSKGILQSGFCSTEKFLMKWTFFLEDQTLPNGMTKTVISQKKSTDSQSCAVNVLVGECETNKVSAGMPSHLTKSSGNPVSDDPKIILYKGPSQFPLKKPFAEVVAGSTASEKAFPPLPPKKQSIPNSEIVNSQKLSGTKVEDKKLATNAVKFRSREEMTDKSGSNFGSGIVPDNVNDGRKLEANTLLKEVVLYIGFEHECPRGHRFLLSLNHLNNMALDASAQDSLDSHPPASKKHPNGHSLDHYVTDMNVPNEPSKLPNLNAEESKSANSIRGCLNEIALDDGGFGFSLLNRNLPIYMHCPHCKNSRSSNDVHRSNFACAISQLQRIFVVTPSFPVVLATCLAVQFEDSCLPPPIQQSVRQSKFSPGCKVILPPDSFLTFSLPFIYSVQLEDKSLHPLRCLDQHPENTAWVIKGTTLQVISVGGTPDE